MTIKTILFYGVVIYLILGLFWYSREDEARQAVADTCKESPAAGWIATIFLILVWPHWLYKRVSLYIHYCRIMSRKR